MSATEGEASADPVGDWLANKLGPEWTVIVDCDAGGWDVAVTLDRSPLVYGGRLDRVDAVYAQEFAAGLVAHARHEAGDF